MIMPPFLRKFALIVHVTSSVGLLGSIAAFLALAIVGFSSANDQTIRACYLAMQIAAKFVIVPLAFAALLTGIIQSFGTTWGLFQHYWVLMKLLLTIFATTILLIKMALISEAARLASETILPRAELHAAGLQLVVHAAGGLCVLLLPMFLSIYKPQGRTRYGWRKLQAKLSMAKP
ncbi:MAG: hypothetical protein M3O03_13395 [Pseudomonadota bacterium]|nr:hypothetical protein [Pseudomonadota bacterium]